MQGSSGQRNSKSGKAHNPARLELGVMVKSAPADRVEIPLAMIEVIELSNANIPTEPAFSTERSVDQVTGIPKSPSPMATGNEKLEILKHDLADAFIDPLDNGKKASAGVELAICNVSQKAIATAVFEAVFYDGEGNVLDLVKHKSVDLRPNTSRAILISSSLYEPGKTKSYAVRLTRMTTADVEKVQPRKHDIWTNENGEEQIHGIVKNISDVKTDAAVVLTFYDSNKENIGTKVVLLKSIEPNSIRQYEVTFKPQEGDTIADYGVAVGDIVAQS